MKTLKCEEGTKYRNFFKFPKSFWANSNFKAWSWSPFKVYVTPRTKHQTDILIKSIQSCVTRVEIILLVEYT